MASISNVCMKHRDKPTAWYCPECEAALCDACVRELTAIGPRACPYCGGRLKQAERRQSPAPPASRQPTPGRQAPRTRQGQPVAQPEPKDRPEDSYAHATSRLGRPDRSGDTGMSGPAEFTTALSYPFRGNGKWLLAGGTVGYIIMGMFQCIPIVRGFLGFVLTAYLVSYLMKVINDSASGGKEPPNWPDMHNFYESLIVPLMRGAACLVMSFLPLIVISVWRVVSVISENPMPFDVSPTLVSVLLIFGAVYLPMALLSVSLWESVIAVGPQKVLPAIGKIGVPYLLVAVLLAGGLVAFQWLEAGLFGGFILACGQLFGPAGMILGAILAYAIASFLSLYFLMLSGRLIGLLYYTYKDRLKWFE